MPMPAVRCCRRDQQRENSAMARSPRRRSAAPIPAVPWRASYPDIRYGCAPLSPPIPCLGANFGQRYHPKKRQSRTLSKPQLRCLQSEGPDVGTAGEARIQRQIFRDGGKAVAHHGADAEQIEEEEACP